MATEDCSEKCNCTISREPYYLVEFQIKKSTLPLFHQQFPLYSVHPNWDHKNKSLCLNVPVLSHEVVQFGFLLFKMLTLQYTSQFLFHA